MLAQHITTSDFCAVWNPQVALYSKDAQSKAASFLERTGHTKNCIKDIVVNGPMTEWYVQQIANPNHQVKRVSRQPQSVADLVILESIVIVSLMSPQSECALEIKNKHFADFNRWYFTTLWELLP